MLSLLAACSGVRTEPEIEAEAETETAPADRGDEADPAAASVPGDQPEVSQPTAAAPTKTVAPITAYGRLPAPTHRDLPEGAPSYGVHVPAGFDASAPFAIVVFLHGWSGCVRALVEPDEVPCIEGGAVQPGWGLARVHDAADTNSILVVPQLSWLARSGTPGAYRVEGTFGSMLDAALAAAREAGAPPGLDTSRARSVILAAHSAGFESALAILEAGDLPDAVDHVLLMDSLYRGTEGFARWVAGGEERRIVSVYTGDQSTYRESQRLAQLTRTSLGPEGVALRPPDVLAAMTTHRVVVAPTRVPHGAIPRLSLPQLLMAWGLPER